MIRLDTGRCQQMEASGHQAKEQGLYPEADFLIKILVGTHVCLHVWAGRYACVQAHVRKGVEWGRRDKDWVMLRKTPC